MTTPNQLPIDRAFVVGGTTVDGSTSTSYDASSFGQDFTDSAIRSLFEIPTLTIGNAVEVFTGLLLKLPLEALQVFGSIIPGGVEGMTDVLTAVTSIIGSLTEAISYLATGDFEGFLDSLLGALGIDGEGSILDKIFDLTDGFDEWFGDFDGLLGSFSDLLGIFGGTSGDLGGIENFITNLLSIFNLGGIGDLTGDTGAFDPMSILTNIPLLGDIIAALSNLFGIFGGTGTGAGDFPAGIGSLGDFVTNLLSIFGGASLAVDPGSFNPLTIPGANVVGTGGPSSTDGTHQSLWDNLWNGLTGSTGATGKSIADVNNAATALQTQVAAIATYQGTTGTHPPEITEFGDAGSYTYNIPTWLVSGDFIDVIAIPGAGGGAAGGFVWGGGGEPGTWVTSTITYGTTIPLTTTTITGSVGAGGAGHTSGNGSNGSNTTAASTGWSGGLTATGGAGGHTNDVDFPGKSPGDTTYLGVTYTGGLAQSTPMGDGNSPGGGGSGGTVFFAEAGTGASGAIFFVARPA